MSFPCETKLNEWQQQGWTRTKINLQTWQEQAIKQLKTSESPLLEVQVLLAHVLKQSRVWVISHPDYDIPSDEQNELDLLLTRLVNGEPLAYLTGNKPFFGLDFYVTPNVLIPRPETELLVEEAIQWLTDNPTKRSAVDAGTGSGAIAISLADAIPDLKILAIDISAPPLEVAKKNCEMYHHEDQITFLQNDLLDGCSEKFDLCVANLPYIPTATLESLPVLKFEPRLALDGGYDGCLYIDRLFNQLTGGLNPGGLALFEIEATTSDMIINHARKIFPDAKIDLLFDYANLPRIVKIQK